jgi:DNA polymerase I
VTSGPHALLVDATTYLYRAYFHRRSLIGRDGSQVNAVYGLAHTLLSLLEDRRPVTAVAAFDHPTAPTFREALFPPYKRGRPPVPERLLPQFAPAQELVRALGFCSVTAPGYEAEDLIATVACWLLGMSAAAAIEIVGEDKDLAQLVGPAVRLRRLETGEVLDEEAVRERFGVPPARIPDLLALQGDAVDGIPGVPGIGERNARRLLAAPCPVESLWDDPDALAQLQLPEAAAVAQRLRDGREAFRLARTLATLRDNVPLDLTREELTYRGIDTAGVRALCDRLGFDQLRDRILALAEQGSGRAARRTH